MFLTEIVDLSNVYEFTSKKEDFNIVTYHFKTNDEYNFSVEFGGDSSGNWDRNFLTKEKQFAELNTKERFKILNTITKITLDFIEKYKPKKINIYHARTGKEVKNNPNDENKRLRVNKYFLSKVLPKNYKINTFGSESEISLVENKLKLKSRAKDIEKEKEEMINNIIKGRDFKELSISDIINIENLKKEFILNYVKNYIIEKYPELGIKTSVFEEDYYIRLSNKHKMLFFINGLNRIVLRIFDTTKKQGFEETSSFSNTKDFINRIDEIVKEYLLNNLNESKINLKSRAKNIEKEKEEIKKEILNKPLENITGIDVSFLNDTELNLLIKRLNNTYKNYFFEIKRNKILNTNNIFFKHKKGKETIDWYFCSMSGNLSLCRLPNKLSKRNDYEIKMITTIGEGIKFLNNIDIYDLNESKQPINEIAELTNTYSYEKISSDGDKVKYRFSDGEDIFFVKFQLLSIGKFGEEYEREYYTTNRWMDELNKGNILRIIGTVTKITLDFINDYKPGQIDISHIDSEKEISGRFSIDAILSGNKRKNSGENKRAKINRLFLSKNLPNDYSMEFISNITKIKRKFD